MRQGSGGRRSRGRHHSGNNGSNNSARAGGDGRVRSAAALRHQTFDSNGPDVRVRGNAWQVFEKYQALARDAASSGDHIMAENLLQHAEHYYRIIEAINEATAAEQRVRSGMAQQMAPQPEVPANYYMPDGQMGNAVVSPPSPPLLHDGAAGEMGQAEVQRRTPSTAGTLFVNEETEEDTSGLTSLAAGR